MEEGIVSLFRKFYGNITNEEINMMPIAKLAFLGDSVFELCVRSLLIRKKYPIKKIHREKVKRVRASYQSEMLRKIIFLLTKEELDFINRAKNIKLKTIPKSSNQKEYRHATALEALIGFLFLKNYEDRIFYLLIKGWEDEGNIITSDS